MNVTNDYNDSPVPFVFHRSDSNNSKAISSEILRIEVDLLCFELEFFDL